MYNNADLHSLATPTIIVSIVTLIVGLLILLPYIHEDGIALIILFFCILLLSVTLIFNIIDTRPRPVHLMFCVYMIFYYILPGYFHTAYGQFPFFAGDYSPDQILRAAVIVAIFVVCTSAAYSLDFPLRGSASRVVVSQNLFKASLFCATAAVVAGAAYGFGQLLTTRGDLLDLVENPGSLMIRAIARSGSFYAFLFGLVLFSEHKRLVMLVPLILAFGLFVVFNLPTAISRTLLGSYIIVTFLTILRISRLQKFLLVVALVASQGTLFSYINYISRGSEESEFVLSPLEHFLTSGDFDGFQSTISVVAMHDEMGAKGGVNLLSAILFFIPRDMWPGKSVGTGTEAAIYAGYPFTTISSPLPSEFYVDFGMPGVVILSLFFGLFVRYCDDYFMQYKRNMDHVGQIFVGTLAGFIFIILRGSLVGVLGSVVLSLAIAGICHRYTTTPHLVPPDNDDDSPRRRFRPSETQK